MSSGSSDRGSGSDPNGVSSLSPEHAISLFNSCFTRVGLPHSITSLSHVLKPGVAALYFSEILEAWITRYGTPAAPLKKQLKHDTQEGPTLRLQHALDAFATHLGLDLSHIHCPSIVYGYKDHVLHAIQLIDSLFNVLDHEHDESDESERPKYDQPHEMDTSQTDSLLEDLDYLENFLSRTKSHLDAHHSPQRPRTAPTRTKATHTTTTTSTTTATTNATSTSTTTSAAGAVRAPSPPYDALDEANTSLERMAQTMGYEETAAHELADMARYVHHQKYHTPTKKTPYKVEHGVSRRLYQSPTDEPEHWDSRKHKLAYSIYKTTKALGSCVSTPSSNSNSYAVACSRVDTLGASRRRRDAQVYQQLLRLIRNDTTVGPVQRKKMTDDIQAEMGRHQARLSYWDEVALERARRVERCKTNQDDAAYRRFLRDELAEIIAKLEAKRVATEKYYQDQYDMLTEDLAQEKRWKQIQHKRTQEAVRDHQRELKKATRDAIELACSRLSSSSEAYRALIQPDEARLNYRPETSVHNCPCC